MNEPAQTTTWPTPPDAKALTDHYELVGPSPAPSGIGICYRIIDRENKMIEPPTLLMITGEDNTVLSGVADTTFREFKRRIFFEAEQKWEDACRKVEEARKPLFSGLRRNLAFDTRMREFITKFENGGSLTLIEYRYLLRFYGILVRMSEIIGEPYALMARDVTEKHRRLVRMAEQDGYGHGVLAMYGVMVEEVFEKFC